MQVRRESATADLMVARSEAREVTGSKVVAPDLAMSPDAKSLQAEPPAAEPPVTERPVTEPDTVRPDTGESEDEEAGHNSAVEAGLNWSVLAYKLGLTGIAQELVANSQLESYADKRIILQLPIELYELVNDLNRGEILQALQQKLEVSLSLELTATSSLVGETPLQARQQREQDERVSAIAAIRDDEMVKKLQHVFGAELDEASVVKIDSNG